MKNQQVSRRKFVLSGGIAATAAAMIPGQVQAVHGNNDFTTETKRSTGQENSTQRSVIWISGNRHSHPSKIANIQENHENCKDGGNMQAECSFQGHVLSLVEGICTKMKTLFLSTPFLFSIPLFAAPSPVNIVLIVAEDMGPHVGCYGNLTVPTPNINRLAQEGVRFENGYVTQASSSPSRSSILTGLHVYQNFQLGLAHMGYTMHKGIPNLPELLKQRDYRTCILGKLHVNPGNEFPFDYNNSGRPAHDNVALFAAKVDEFLNDTGDLPFFLMFNFWDCHRDQTGGGPPFPDTRFGLPEYPVGPDDVNIFPEHGEIDELFVREEVAGYYNAIQRVDIGIGMLLDVLAKYDKLDNTLVIFIGDHGPSSSRGKTTTYEFGIKVPYIVRWPGMAKAGLESDALVSTIDIVPTCMSAAGLEIPSYLPGRSLVPVLQGEDGNWRSILVAEWHTHGPGFAQPQRSIRDGRYKLILNMRSGVRKPGLGIDGCKVAQALKLSKYNGTEVQRVFHMLQNPPEIELYDLQEDPIEYHNLADDPGHREIKEDLMRQLQAYRERTGDPFLDPDFFESVLQYTEANARSGKIDMTPFQRNFKDIEDGLLFIAPRE